MTRRNPSAVQRTLANTAVRLDAAWRTLHATCLAMMGPTLSYALAEAGARLLYALVPPLRIRCESQCRAALADRYTPAQCDRIARQAFVHRMWDLADLLLSPRLMHPNTIVRYGGELQPELRRQILDAQARRQPLLLVTAYYGPIDLLPILLGFNGIHASVVYKPHVNRNFDALRYRLRSRGGCELVPIEHAASRIEQVLDDGGTAALVADHHDQRRGMEATFMGLPCKMSRSVGLLAWRYDAEIIVAALRRVKNRCRYEWIVDDVIRPTHWAGTPDPVSYIIRRYLARLEHIILDDPAQYLWGHTRWGSEQARRLTDEYHANAGEDT